MALPSCHVNSPEDTQLGTTCPCRYLTCHPTGGTEPIEEKERAALSPQRTAMKIWGKPQELSRESNRDQPAPLMRKGSNRPAPCMIKNDEGSITWNGRSKP